MSAHAIMTPPKQPPGLDHDKAWAAGLRAGRRAPGLRIVSWNIWFDEKRQAERLSLLLAALAAADADVVGLQEVTDDVAATLRAHEGLNERYAISPNPIYGYGCLLLVRHALRPDFSELRLTTTMGRTAIVAELGTGAAVATVHLESLDSERTRRNQLVAIAERLRGFGAACVFGDFNFDDRRTWPEWRDPRRRRDVLENAVLGEVLPEYADAWPAARGTELGYTMDGSVNRFMHDKQERVRYDRVMAKGFRVAAAELLGSAPAAGGLFVSDHFGVRVDVEEVPS